MQQTEKYGFNLIDGGDDFSAAPLNENMEKVEERFQAAETARIKFQFLHYKGNGAATRTFTFAFKPQIVILGREDGYYRTAVFFRGQSTSLVSGYTGDVYIFNITWGENSVTIKSSAPVYICNYNNENYHLFAAG